MKKRMFSDDITSNDIFIDMPATTQLLYFQIGMETDDEGFCDKVKTCMFRSNAKPKDLKLLIDNKYLIDFGKVVLVKHHFMNNTKRSDRLKETKWQEYRNQVELDSDGIYHFKGTNDSQDDNQVSTKCQPMVSLNQIKSNQYKSNQIKDDLTNNKLINRLTDFEREDLEGMCRIRMCSLNDLIRNIEFKKPNGIEHPYEYLKGVLEKDENWRV